MRSSNDFAQSLWAWTEGKRSPLPAGTGLLAPVFALLPAPSGIDVEERVRAFLFEADIKRVLAISDRESSTEPEETGSWLDGVRNSWPGPLRPTADQAARLFDDLVSWRPLAVTRATAGAFAAGFYRSIDDSNRRLIGEALALVAAPALSRADRTVDRARALFHLIDSASVSAALAALPYFAEAEEELRAEILRRLRRGVNWRAFNEVAASAKAIEIWAGLDLTTNELGSSK